MEEEKSTFYRYLPYLGSFIIFLGVERLIIYYNAFNINIIHFLEFSEIITSFLDILTFIVLITAFSVIQQFFFQDSAESKENKKKLELKTKLFDENNFWKRVKLYWQLFGSVLLGGLTGIIIIRFFSSFRHSTSFWSYASLVILYIVIFIIAIIIVESEVKHKRLNSKRGTRIFIRFVFFFIFVTGFLFFMTKDEIKSVKDSKKYYKVVVTLNDSIKLVSDSNNYYIGKTQNFLFFYHEKTKTTNVFPMNQVTEIEFPKKNYR